MDRCSKWTEIDLDNSRPVQVVAERVALRSGPSLGAPVLGQVPRGVLAGDFWWFLRFLDPWFSHVFTYERLFDYFQSLKDQIPADRVLIHDPKRKLVVLALLSCCNCSWWKDTICFPSIEHRWLIEALEIFFFLVTTLFQRSDSNRFTCCTPVWVVSSGDGSPPFLLQVGVIFYLFCYRLWWRMVTFPISL